MTPQEEQFLQAAKDGNKAYIKEHLNNVSSDIKLTAFVYTPYIEISQLLYQNGINPMDYCKEKFSSGPEYIKHTALTMACKCNDLEKAQWLISICPEIINLPSEFMEEKFIPIYHRNTPLQIAIKKGHWHLIKLLKKMDAEYNKDDYKLASKELQPIILDLLSSENPSMCTNLELFWEAARQGWISYIQTYLEQGIDINAPTPTGKTALMLAAQGGQKNCVAMLLSSNADMTKRDENDYTAILYAAIGGNVETIKYLLQAGSKIEDKNKYGMTPLMLAIREENTDAVRFLLESQADINTVNIYGQTALKTAITHNNQEIINLLKSAGATE